MCVCTLHVSE
uniref:Uncharacterized protein n=1 Tax=Anguilla anguilla TaxID=7936 RepID=A0A0E9QTL7_ANGAN